MPPARSSPDSRSWECRCCPSPSRWRHSARSCPTRARGPRARRRPARTMTHQRLPSWRKHGEGVPQFTILVVDDDPDVLDTVAELLEAGGYTRLAAASRVERRTVNTPWPSHTVAMPSEREEPAHSEAATA